MTVIVYIASAVKLEIVQDTVFDGEVFTNLTSLIATEYVGVRTNPGQLNV